MKKLITPLLLTIIALEMISAAWPWEIERLGRKTPHRNETSS